MVVCGPCRVRLRKPRRTLPRGSGAQTQFHSKHFVRTNIIHTHIFIVFNKTKKVVNVHYIVHTERRSTHTQFE